MGFHSSLQTFHYVSNVRIKYCIEWINSGLFNPKSSSTRLSKRAKQRRTQTIGTFINVSSDSTKLHFVSESRRLAMSVSVPECLYSTLSATVSLSEQLSGIECLTRVALNYHFWVDNNMRLKLFTMFCRLCMSSENGFQSNSCFESSLVHWNRIETTNTLIKLKEMFDEKQSTIDSNRNKLCK